MTTRVTLVKTEKVANGHSTDDSNVEPLNFKVESTVTSSRPQHIPMDVDPVTTNSSITMEACNTLIPHSSSIAPTTKIYANLESAMPVSTVSQQQPITIQTIEVIMKFLIACIE